MGYRHSCHDGYIGKAARDTSNLSKHLDSSLPLLLLPSSERELRKPTPAGLPWPGSSWSSASLCCTAEILLSKMQTHAFKINAYPGILIPCMPVSKVKATRAKTGKEVESEGEKRRGKNRAMGHIHIPEILRTRGAWSFWVAWPRPS